MKIHNNELARLFTCIAVFMMSCIAMGQSQSEMISQIAAASAAVKDLECSFLQTKHLSMLNDKMVSYGKMSYHKPNRLRWEYTSPMAYVFAMDGDKVSITDKGHTKVVDAKKHKGFREVSKMMSEGFFEKSLTDPRLFTTTVTCEKKPTLTYVATLVPKRKELKMVWSKLVLHFDVNNKMVKRAEMSGKNGDLTVIEFERK